MRIKNLAAITIGASKKHIELQEDTTIGILWAVGMASGVLFIGMSKGYAVNLFSYLFGNILAVSTFDLTLMAALSAFIITAVALLFKEFLILTFDEEYASIVGIPTQALSIFLLGKTFSANQIEFINLIINHLAEHGVMDAALLYESPFTDLTTQGPDGLFTSTQVDELISALDQITATALVS